MASRAVMFAFCLVVAGFGRLSFVADGRDAISWTSIITGKIPEAILLAVKESEIFRTTLGSQENCLGPARKELGDICSSLTGDDIISCGLKNVSKSSCLAKGCCWNDSAVANLKNLASLNDIHCYRSKHLNGTCIKYPQDGICFKYLNNSVPQFRNTPRFIDYNIGLNKTNALMNDFQELVTLVAKDEFSERCLQNVRILLCQYVLTPCADDGTPIQICREDCDMFEKECPKTLQKLIGGARVSLSKSHADFVHINIPDCSYLKYKEELEKTGQKCYMSGLFAMNNSDDSDKDKTVVIVAVTVVAAVAVTCFIACLLYRRRKHRETRSKLEHGSQSMKPRGLGMYPSISVKDHINNLCADDLLKSKMPVNDPKKMKQYPVELVAYEKDLGEGQFGQVFQGRAVGLDESNPEAEVIVAVKTLKKGSSTQAKADFDQEACLMNFLDHPNIVKLLAVSAMEEPYCMIFEFMCKGDLSEYLRKSEPLVENNTEPMDENKNYLSQETLIKMCVDVAQGLQYLASHRLVHRDVATRNCLVADDLTIKIADFGMSRDIYSNNYYKMIACSSAVWKTTCTSEFFEDYQNEVFEKFTRIERETVLPIRWLSPEAVMFGKFAVESDIYSFGILVWEVFTFSMQPYYGYTNKEVLEFISKGIHLAKPDFCPDFVYRIMKDCWAKESELRPYYNSIIDRLHGKETTYDTPRPLANDEQRTALYQNVPLHQNDVDEDGSLSGNDNKDPLLSENREKEGNDGTNTPKENSEGDKGVYKASNPLFEATTKRNSSVGSEGSVNSGMDFDSEHVDDSTANNGNGPLRRTQLNDKPDDVFSRMNKTYV